MQIDLLKGLMILLVMIDHAIPWDVRNQWGHSLWERISIPVFMIIMGFNGANSFQVKGVPLDSFSALMKFYWEKAKRYLFPFLFIYITFTLLGVYFFYDGLEELLQEQFYPHWAPSHLFILAIPFTGPGDWFIIVLFQTIIILPFLYWIYKKAPRVTLFLSFFVEIAIQTIVFSIFGHPYSWTSVTPQIQRTFIQCSVLFFINAIVLGFWIADHKNLGNIERSQQNHMKWSFYLGLLVFIVGYVLIMKFVLIEPLAMSIFSNSFLHKLLNQWYLLSVCRRHSEGFLIMLLIILVQIYLAIFLYHPRKRYFTVILPLTLASLVGFLYVNAIYTDTSTFLAPNFGLYILVLLIFAWPIAANILSRFKQPLTSNWFFWICSPVSAFYIILHQFSSLTYFSIAGDYHFFVYSYSAFIILVVLSLLPNTTSNSLVHGLQYLGKATYHILLTQMMYYGITIWRYDSFWFNQDIQTYYWGGLLSNLSYTQAVWIYVLTVWTVSIPIGMLWYFIERKFYSLPLYFKNKKLQRIQDKKSEQSENKSEVTI